MGGLRDLLVLGETKVVVRTQIDYGFASLRLHHGSLRGRDYALPLITAGLTDLIELPLQVNIE
jgi:hypothetical protein